MRKVKLVVQTSLDGFTGDITGNTNWMVWNWGDEWTWDDELRNYHTSLITEADCLLLSRKMAEEGFHAHWERVVENTSSPQYRFAKHIIEMPKLVFSKTLTGSPWKNSKLAVGDYAELIANVKHESGRDILLFGGPTFAASLLRANLIDELYIFINPAVLGEGKALFKERNTMLNLNLVACRTFECGVVVLHYVPVYSVNQKIEKLFNK